MAKTKKQKTQKGAEELTTVVADLRNEIVKLSMEKAKRQLKNTTLLRTKKDELARALTQISMQKFMNKQSVKEEQK